MEHKKNIGQYSQSRSFYIGERNTNRYLYKYMDLESAIISLTNGSIRFVEPHTWQDKFEGRFYNASFAQVKGAAGHTPPVLACCLTHASVNEASWKVYSYRKTGLGAHCVQFKINKKLFREAVAKSAKGFSLYEGMTSYELDDYQIQHLHERYTQNGTEKELFKEFFGNFDLSSYLSLLLIKRQAFRHEEEVRYFLVPEEDETEMRGGLGPEDISINWKDFLVNVKVDEECSDTELNILRNVLNLQGIMINPTRQYIYAAEEGPITVDSNED